MSADPVIAGVGIMTAVGLSAPETAAAIRSATMRFTETAIRDEQFDPITFAEVPDEGLPKPERMLEQIAGLTSRETRLLRLAAPALVECLATTSTDRARVPLVLALPEMQPAKPIDGKRFLELLATHTSASIDPDRSFALDVGRAGGLLAIARASELIRSGKAKFAVAGGVDTYRDLYVLASLDREQRLKSARHLDAFVPGEGAAFVLLASATAASAAGLTPLARVSAAAQGVEAGHLYSAEPYRGDGLASTITELVKTGVASTPFGDVWSSMNGENHWAKEWSVSFLRNRAAFAEDHGIHHPADCAGDTGAACGPLMVALAALGIRGGYRRSPALVYCSSDRGARAALAVTGA